MNKLVKAMLIIGAVTAVALLSFGGYLLFGQREPNYVDVPHVDGMPAADAVAALEDLDLVVHTLPDVELTGDAAEQWTAARVSAADGLDTLEEGDIVQVRLESSLEQAVNSCGVGEIEDEGSTLLIDGAGKYGMTIEDLVCLLAEIDTPSSTIALIDSTRALDGRQEDSWDGIQAQWTYHPDNGLDMVLTLED